MRILIIDDEYPSRSELRFLITHYFPEIDLGEAESGKAALEKFEMERYDAAFVDIHLGDITGTILAGVLREKQPDLKIIFATAYDDYAVQAFELGAVDYIMKPFDPERVKASINRIQTSHKDINLPGKICITLSKKKVVLDINQIAYIESRGKNCIVHAEGKEYQSVQHLGTFVERLPASIFFRPHKSYLVNLNYISEVTPWVNSALSLLLAGYPDDLIPVSRNQVKRLKDIFGL